MIYGAWLPKIELRKLGASLPGFWVNPNRITSQIKKVQKISNDWLQRREFFEYFVIGGNWDNEGSPVPLDRNFGEMKELIRKREDYRSSPAYKKCVSEVRSGIPQKGHHGRFFRDEEDVAATFEYYLDVISSMEQNGYIPQSRVSGKKDDSDVGVAVTRRGTLMHFRTGHHRLAVAQLLDLPRIRVTVHLVHDVWAESAKQEFQKSTWRSIELGLSRLAEREKLWT